MSQSVLAAREYGGLARMQTRRCDVQLQWTLLAQITVPERGAFTQMLQGHGHRGAPCAARWKRRRGAILQTLQYSLIWHTQDAATPV